ncbi:senescence-specific cysteine protease SAG12-like [Dioscorea cayenensis subsp. rotundata]|uniref:Senescence-specific cysteine protease SAG12-like n=1 Tax=Dioscorea cayennensis subsp. rotundata TaxID=55577 RepID=A0AB40BZQ0_DIOCR|nr:senescence-specific cysteine protease SAG12-like [Dioscorea cayenensis subsp. rotundata]
MFKYQNVNVTDLPESVDWRDKGAVTPIKRQGGFMLGFAALAAVEGAFKINTGRLVSLNGDVTLEDNYPYTETQGCCQERKARTPVAYISDYQHVPANKEALLKHVAHQTVSAVVFSEKVNFRQYRGGLFFEHHEDYPNHTVTIVRYGKYRNGI